MSMCVFIHNVDSKLKYVNNIIPIFLPIDYCITLTVHILNIAVLAYGKSSSYDTRGTKDNLHVNKLQHLIDDIIVCYINYLLFVTLIYNQFFAESNVFKGLFPLCTTYKKTIPISGAFQ